MCHLFGSPVLIMHPRHIPMLLVKKCLIERFKCENPEVKLVMSGVSAQQSVIRWLLFEGLCIQTVVLHDLSA